MRVTVLGGGGDEGGTEVGLLAKRPDVEKVIAADRSLARAERVAQKVGEKVEAKEIDIYDHDGLVKLLKGNDIVINMVGPFHRHGTTVLKGAIDAKIDYLDICDDWDTTIELMKLDGAAKKAGITALITMGSSPGVVSVIAMYGVAKLDKTHEIRVLWMVNYGSAGGGAGAAFHGWHMMKGDIPQFLDGKLVYVKAGTGKEIVEFTDGQAEVFYVGHPEPITIPPFVPGVKTVVNKGSMTPQWLSEDQLKMIELGFGEEEMVKIHGDVSIRPVEVALRVQNLYLRNKDMGPPFAGLKIEIIGVKDGKKASLVYTIDPEVSASGSMSAMTVLPASIGARMVVRGEVKRKGVVTPEELDCVRFLKILDEEGGAWYEFDATPRKMQV